MKNRLLPILLVLLAIFIASWLLAPAARQDAAPDGVIQDFNLASPATPIPNGWSWAGAGGANLQVEFESGNVSEGPSSLKVIYGKTTTRYAEGYVGLIDPNSGVDIDFSNTTGISFDVKGNFASDADSVTFRWHLRSLNNTREFVQQDTIREDLDDFRTVRIEWQAFTEFKQQQDNGSENLMSYWKSANAQPLKELGVAIVIESPGANGSLYIDNIKTYTLTLGDKLNNLKNDIFN